ncbi:SET domain-containing protein [Gymnopus androsaceus JB14]|uniref:SET domain-containing protein n=1 Tax=Gymnopus androsaceus JB14 TaxID=1447944 RepID=A0A6A4I233_9AGAR|nr:SET domain-containing protein [Gymnopus androsaceus JB14]
MDPARINSLLNWCSINNIEIDKRLQIVPDDIGLAVYSGSISIGPSETLVKIPKASVLSVKSCSAARFIESSSYGLEAQLALSLGLLVELERGARSRWYGYLQSLPAALVDLPSFWNSGTSDDGPEALELLKGTEAERLLLGPGGIPLIDHLHQYFNETVVPTLTRIWAEENTTVAMKPYPSLQRQFFRAYSLVSSRAFLVDAYHGLSMVPIADAFNHTYENHVHLETEYQVCPECGSLKQCPHDRDLDMQNAGAPESGHDEDDDDESYDMVSNTEIPPHSEIFNTYGETLTNAQLLTQYGFVLDVNENDRINWQFDDLIQALTALHPGTSIPVQNTPLGLPWNTLVESFNPAIFSNSELIFFHPGNPNNDSATTFCINCEGKTSWQLWLLITSHNCAQSIPADDILALLLQVARYQIAQEATDDNDDDAPENNTILLLVKTTASVVVELCRQRKACIGDGRDQENLGDMIDELDASQTKTKLALLIVMTELSILNSCEAAWGEIFSDPRSSSLTNE